MWTEKNVSRTGVECQWSKSKSDITDEQSVESSKSVQMWPSVSKAGAGRQVDDEDRNYLFQRLSALGRSTGQWWILSPEPASVSQPTHRLTFDSIRKSDGYSMADDNLSYLLQNMRPSAEERRTIVELTSGQRKNCMWLQYKKMRLTASNFGRVLNAINHNRFTKPLFKSLERTFSHLPYSGELIMRRKQYQSTAGGQGSW